MIFLSFIFHIHRRCRSQESFVCRRCRDRTCIHKRYGRNLSALQLGSLTVREVSCGVADGKRIVCRRISRSEARSAERRLHDRSRCHQICHRSVFHQFHINRRTCRVYAECELVRTDILSADNVCRCADIFKSAARASCDDSLLHIQLSVYDLVLQCVIDRTVQTDKRFLLYIVKNVFEVCIQLIDRIYVARMERHRDHWFDLA